MPMSNVVAQYVNTHKFVRIVRERTKAKKEANAKQSNIDASSDRLPRTDTNSTGGSKRSDDAEERKGPWAQLVVLSVDGGGVDGFAMQGLSSLLIIQALMREIAKQEQSEAPHAFSSADSPMVEPQKNDRSEALPFFPHHYFDYIAGTSSGSLIAVMLGRLRMSVDSTIDLYKRMASVIPRYTADPHLIAGMYLRKIATPTRMRRNSPPATTRKALESMDNACKEKSFRSDATRCRTIICSLRRDRRRAALRPFLFTSYEKPWEVQAQATGEVFHVGEVVSACSCTTSALSPVKLGHYQYYNAGFSSSNPSAEVFQEISQAEYSCDPSMRTSSSSPVKIFLSIGCGTITPKRLESDAAEDLNKTDNLEPSQREKSGLDVHEAMLSLAKAKKFKELMYHRFDVGHIKHPHGAGMPEEMYRHITSITNEYLRIPTVATSLKEYATELVKLRRQRSQTSRWEAFAIGAKYKCVVPKASCDLQVNGTKVTRQELVDHLRVEHRVRRPFPAAGVVEKSEKNGVEGPLDNIQMLVKKGRTYSD